MAEPANSVRAAIATADPDTVRAALLALVDRCDRLHGSNYPAYAGMADSMLRDAARVLGERVPHQEFRFAPQDLTSGVRDGG